jgi:phenylpyruvate tautomerase PptA (4-oxalocrotonate tautomerase family)
MPLYVCNSATGAIDDTARRAIAADITRIHCDATGAPPAFVHAFFFEDAPHLALNGKTAVLFGSIRQGRTDAQKARIVEEMRNAFHAHTDIPLDEIVATTADVPARWVMEGGDVLPDPGEEAEWLAAHAAKSGAAASPLERPVT